MTAPVLTGPKKIDMTAPVLTSNSFMQFVLPAEFVSLEQIPSPKDESISIKSVPRRIVAVTRFSGSYSRTYFDEKLQELYNSILKDDWLKVADDKDSSENRSVVDRLPWSFAQYNPPFTLPPFRRNEVWIEIPPQQFTVKLEEMVRSVEQK